VENYIKNYSNYGKVVYLNFLIDIVHRSDVVVVIVAYTAIMNNNIIILINRSEFLK